jgi:hypothetical protein
MNLPSQCVLLFSLKIIIVLTVFRDYNEGDSPAEGGEGSAQPQDLTPQQQHQQYLGETRPELEQFPDIQWAGTPIPGEELSLKPMRSYLLCS